MIKIDLTNLTELELFDLAQQITDERKARPNRVKWKIYKVFVPFLFNLNFLDQDNAKKFLSDNLLDGIIDLSLDDPQSPTTIGVDFIDKSSIQFCTDYENLCTCKKQNNG